MGGDIFNIITTGEGVKVRVGEARYRLNNWEKFNEFKILCNLHRNLCILKFVLTQVDDKVVYHSAFSTFKCLRKCILRKYVVRIYVLRKYV
jgi:hypothetical protein